jgi:hypothetical protein
MDLPDASAGADRPTARLPDLRHGFEPLTDGAAADCITSTFTP